MFSTEQNNIALISCVKSGGNNPIQFANKTYINAITSFEGALFSHFIVPALNRRKKYHG